MTMGKWAGRRAELVESIRLCALGVHGSRVLAAAALLLTSRLGADPVRLDYDLNEQQVVVGYDKGLAITLINVNALDYDYKVSIEAVPPPPMPQPPRIGPVPTRTKDCTDLTKDLSKVNEMLRGRVARFGLADLLDWRDEVIKELEKPEWCPEGKDQLLKLIASESDLLKASERPLLPAELSSSLSSTGAGGALKIRVNAKPSVTIVRFVDDAFVAESRKMDAAEVDKHQRSEKIREHMEERKFTVEFEPPPGIIFTFGPYLSDLDREEFERVLERDSTDKYVIGFSEDSPVTYGVAAFWNATILPNWTSGLSWGVAYNLQNEPELAVAGLLGVFWTPHFVRTPVLVHVGAAVGRAKTLGGGRKPGDSIGANEEIPTTAKTKVRVFGAISFNIGRGR